MPAFSTGFITTVTAQRPGLQKVMVALASGQPSRAYVLTELIGSVDIGDEVIVNTTAVDLGLGTGGWHFVHWNLRRREWQQPGPGHIMKLRYTSLQADVGSTEEHHRELEHVETVDPLVVIASSLHSQLAGIAVAARHAKPGCRIAYVMTDGAALPLALSDLVASLREKSIIDCSITAGQAFGGDYEAVSLASALVIARHVVNADIAIVAMGPGIVGTNTALGYSGVELASTLDMASALGARSIACLRASDSDPRERHRNISHHTVSALSRLTSRRSEVAFPHTASSQFRDSLEASRIDARHEVREVQIPDVVALFTEHQLKVSSMGRAAKDDPILHECAAAAAVLACSP